MPRNAPQQSVEDINEMFQRTAELGSVTVIRLPWNDDKRVDAARFLLDRARARGLTPVLQFDPLKADGIEGAEIQPPSDVKRRAGKLSFADAELADAYTGAVLELARLQPPYLAVAVDLNLLWLSEPSEQAAFARVYGRLHDQVRRIAPDTRVFATFQWEALQNQPRHREGLAALRPDLDLLALSSRPRERFERQGAAGIPADHYQAIRKLRQRGEELLLEVAWPSDGSDGEAEQVAFIRALPKLTAGLAPSMLTWGFLHDVKILVFTLRMGLLTADGRPKPAYEAYKALGGARPVRAESLAGATAARSKGEAGSRRPAHFGIYTARLDGSDMQPLLTSDDREMTHPRVSPDGTRVVLTRYNRRGKDGKATEEQGYEDTEVMVMNIDGSGLETVIPSKPGVIAANGCWTPDGKSLIFLSTDNPDRDPRILRIDLSTRRITRMPTPPGLKTTDPHWEAGQLVFPVKGKDVDALWLMNADGSRARQITRPKLKRGLFQGGLLGDFDPKLSPDGTKVAFMRNMGGTEWRVVVLDVDTGEEHLLSSGPAMEWLPTWSSDGRKLLFVHVDLSKPSEIGLYTMTPDGRDRRMVPLPRGYFYGHSSFFPDGGSSDQARIIFTATRNPKL